MPRNDLALIKSPSVSKCACPFYSLATLSRGTYHPGDSFPHTPTLVASLASPQSHSVKSDARPYTCLARLSSCALPGLALILLALSDSIVRLSTQIRPPSYMYLEITLPVVTFRAVVLCPARFLRNQMARRYADVFKKQPRAFWR